MTAMRSKPSSSGRRISALVGMLGVLVLVAFAALVVWLVVAAKAPGLDRLEQVTGRVKSVATANGQTTSRTLKLVVTADGMDHELTLPRADQLPVRDWPLESINAGERVVAWYVPVGGTKSAGTLWQLHRGQQRVVALEDAGRLQREWVGNALSWCALGLLFGATLIAAGFGWRDRSALSS